MIADQDKQDNLAKATLRKKRCRNAWIVEEFVNNDNSDSVIIASCKKDCPNGWFVEELINNDKRVREEDEIDAEAFNSSVVTMADFRERLKGDKLQEELPRKKICKENATTIEKEFDLTQLIEENKELKKKLETLKNGELCYRMKRFYLKLTPIKKNKFRRKIKTDEKKLFKTLKFFLQKSLDILID